jgi:hypothetical protein
MCCGKNFIKCLIISHSGNYSDQVTKHANLVIVGDKPGNQKIKRGVEELGIHLTTYESLQKLIAAMITQEELVDEPNQKSRDICTALSPQ